MSRFTLLTLFTFLASSHVAQGHVALIYPPP